jgi:hypothetical protein
MVGFMPLPLYHWYPLDRTLGRKFLTLLGLEHGPLNHPACSQSLTIAGVHHKMFGQYFPVFDIGRYNIPSHKTSNNPDPKILI